MAAHEHYGAFIKQGVWALRVAPSTYQSIKAQLGQSSLPTYLIKGLPAHFVDEQVAEFCTRLHWNVEVDVNSRRFRGHRLQWVVRAGFPPPVYSTYCFTAHTRLRVDIESAVRSSSPLRATLLPLKPFRLRPLCSKPTGLRLSCRWGSPYLCPGGGSTRLSCSASTKASTDSGQGSLLPDWAAHVGFFSGASRRFPLAPILLSSVLLILSGSWMPYSACFSKFCLVFPLLRFRLLASIRSSLTRTLTWRPPMWMLWRALMPFTLIELTMPALD